MASLLSSVSTKQWTVIGLFNLTLVAVFGVLMRTSAVFPQGWFNQKYIMHAHSHFAFSGWISHMLMVLMAMTVLKKKPSDGFPWRYQLLFAMNMLASYGMLFCFSWQGYGRYSIICSTLTLVLSYFFVGMMWRSIIKTTLSPLVRKWFQAALIFLLISSIGTFYLGYLQATHNVDTKKQLASVYFFLHFQQNGWFFFSCLGLLSHWLVSKGIALYGDKVLFHTLVWGCLPTYLLSVLWWEMPVWLYSILVMAVACQNLSWFYWLISFRRSIQVFDKYPPVWIRLLLLVVSVAVSIKYLSQAVVLIPAFNSLTYSFRPLVVGYLHLVLLGIVTLFILAFVFLNDVVRETRFTKWILSLFVFGIVANEFLLLGQGLTGMQGIYIPHIPLALMIAAVVMLISLLSLSVSIIHSYLSSR